MSDLRSDPDRRQHATEAPRVLASGSLEAGGAVEIRPREPTVLVGESLSFRSVGNGPPGASVERRWAFGDDPLGGSASGRTVTHTFETVGRHTVYHCVRDPDRPESGPRGHATTRVRVLPQWYRPPVARIEADRRTVAVGEPVTFYSAGRDPDDVVAEYRWAFEDGADGVHATGRSVTHAFERAGTHAVYHGVRDENGDGGMDEPHSHDWFTVTVVDPDE